MSDTLKNTPPDDETIPVLIVGGSVVGLSTSLFLAWHGIPSLLVERHPGISPYGRAGAFNQRSIELFRPVGLEPAIRQQETPPSQLGKIVRVESLAGKELDPVEQSAQPQQNPFADTGEISPVKASMIGQNVLEPILYARAKELGSTIHFGTEMISFEQDTDGVTAFLREQAIGKERLVRARYLVAADGNRSSIRQCLGIGTHGYGSLAHYVNIRFRADLREALRGRNITICFVNNPAVQGFLGSNGEVWGLGATLHPEQGDMPEHVSEARCVELVRAAVGVPDLAVEIVGVPAYWESAARVADRYQQGRVLLAGDAAHVMPPTGAFGANTGIADAHNLAWKLAYVLKGMAHPDLLATYQTERQPVAHLAVGVAVGLYAHRLLNQEDGEAVRRSSEDLLARVMHGPNALRPTGFSVIMGYRYRSAAILSDTEEDKENWTMFANQPLAQPGFRAPHVVLEHAVQQFSTIDLYSRNFVLLTGTEGNVWCAATRTVSEHMGLVLDAYRVGKGGDYSDSEGNFLTTYGITSAGAVLICPDGFMAWRSRDAVENAERTLEQVLSALLFR